MKTSTLAILGLVAIAQAMPAQSMDVERRDERVANAPVFAPIEVREPQRRRGGGGSKGGSKGDSKGRRRGNGGGGSWGGSKGGHGGGGSYGPPDDHYGGPPSSPPSGGPPSSPPSGGPPSGPPSPHDDGGDHECHSSCSGDGPPDFEDFPDLDIPDVSIEDIIKAQQELVIMQNILPTIDDPMQRMALERGIEQIKAFLEKHAGISDISAPPGVGTILRPGLVKRGDRGHGRTEREAVFKILDEWNSICDRYPRDRPPPFAVYMIACQLAEILEAEGFDIDFSILDAWSTFQISDKVKRQDGIFALPGSCGIDDVVGLETILATIQLIYGSNPPDHIRSLKNAVTAALIFCGAATAEGGAMVPERPSPGAPVTPDRPTPGGSMAPDPIEEGGEMDPDEPEEGAPMEPDEPEEGAPLEPDEPEEGAPLEPSDKKVKKRQQHPTMPMEPLADALAVLEEGYGGFGEGKIPMPIFIIMQSMVALSQSYGIEVEGWPDLVGESVKLLPPAE